MPSSQEVDHQVSSNPKQPVAEPAFFGYPAFNGTGYSNHHFLDQLVSIGILHTLAAREPIDERLVDGRKLFPCLDVPPMGQACNQAVAGIGDVTHC